MFSINDSKKKIQKIIPYSIRMFISRTIFVLRYPLKHINVCFNYILHNRDKFINNITIVAMIKNEREYIKEWLEYHKLVGVDKFVIYDNNSTDNLKEILQPYIETGEVDYIFYPKTQADFEKKGKKAEYWAFQACAYNDAVKKYRNKSKWIGFIDIDEFIVPVKKDSIIDVINEIEKDVLKGKLFAGLAINWVMYGFSGHREKPKGLIIENYAKNDGIHEGIKSIVNPRTVIQYQVHAALHFFKIEVVNERGIKAYTPNVSQASIEKIRINHYYTKSYEEYAQKITKGRIGWPKADKYNLPDYDPDYLSHNADKIMERFIPLLKEIKNDKTTI
jgi:hypothetical protein